MKNATFVLLLSLGFVLFGCKINVAVETSSGDGTTTDDSGGSGGSDEGGSGGATTTTDTGEGGAQYSCPPLIISLDQEFSTWGLGMIGSEDSAIFGRYVIENGCDLPVDPGDMILIEGGQGGKSQDFTFIYLFDGDIAGGYKQITAFEAGQVVFSIAPGDFTIPAHGKRHVNITGRMAEVQPSAILGDDIPRSGDLPSLKLMSVTDNEGQKAVFKGDIDIAPLLLRKSEPTLWFTPQLPDPLKNGVNTVLHLEISAKPGRTLGVRNLVFRLDYSAEMAIDVDNIEAPFTVNGVPQPKSVYATIHAVQDTWAMAVLTFLDHDQLVDGDSQPLTIDLQINLNGVGEFSWIETGLLDSYDDQKSDAFQLLGDDAPGVLFGLTQDPADTNYMYTSLWWTDLVEGNDHEEGTPTSFDYYTRYLVYGAETSSLVTAF